MKHPPPSQSPVHYRSLGHLSFGRDSALLVTGSLALAASAQITVPMLPVPMTMQSCALLLISAAYGCRLATATVIAYLIEGAAGLPVFAGGAGGIAYLAGPTAGFLAGFLMAAALIGHLFDRGAGRNGLHALLALTAGHCLLFVPGMGWLSTFIGWEAAWTKGVLPFVAGTIVKTLLAFTVLLALRRIGSQWIATSEGDGHE